MIRFALCLAALAFPLAVLAEPLVIEQDQEADAADIAKVLNPEKFKTRGAADSAAKAASVVLKGISFAFGSSKLELSSRKHLDALAEAIKLAGVRVAVEGHTDSKGSVEYNRRLSQKRAEAVREYLAVQQGIDRTMVRAVGIGKEKPLPNVDPTSAENRRVEARPDR